MSLVVLICVCAGSAVEDCAFVGLSRMERAAGYAVVAHGAVVARARRCAAAFCRSPWFAR